jgi:ubiquinone biosynthesis protein UbiJ
MTKNDRIAQLEAGISALAAAVHALQERVERLESATISPSVRCSPSVK